jgi:bacterioferritin (cytochrome b1)
MPPDVIEIDAETEPLNGLLSDLLSAVSQQFFHMLLLRKRGERDMFKHLKMVDDVDFVNAMQIIDLLMSRGECVLVAQHSVSPGNSTRSILLSELEFENEFATRLDNLRTSTKAASALVDKAKEHREGHRAWLHDQLGQWPGHLDAEDRRQDAELISLLLHLMEQTLLHAFAYWHEGKTKEADTAWQISGAAMLYLTALVDYCGSDELENAKIEIAGAEVVEPHLRLDHDLDLVKACSREAHRLAGSVTSSDFARLCLEVAEDCDRVAKVQNGCSIEADLGHSPIFSKFERAVKRMNS